MASMGLSIFLPPNLDTLASKKNTLISSMCLNHRNSISHSASARFVNTRKTLITNSNGYSKASPTVKIKTPITMDINQIMEILPHRFPFLLLDKVLDFTPGVSAVGIKNVSMNESFFAGHFPDRPIVPGVLMLEAIAQLGAIVLIELGGGSSDKLAITGAENVRFRRHVVPGDTLVMTATLIKYQRRFRFAKMIGTAYVGDEVACECNITAVI